MLNKKTVYNGLEMLCVNFSIDKTQDELKTFCRVTYPMLSDSLVTDNEFVYAVTQFMKKTSGSNFNKLPSVGDFLKMVGKTPKSTEELAKEQAQLVWEGGYTYAEKLLFDNATTNYVIDDCFNGLSNFRWKYLNSQNENRVSDNWGKKEFIENWIIAYERGREQFEPLRSNACTSDSNIKMIGDVSKIELMLEHNPKENKQANLLIKNLANNMKR